MLFLYVACIELKLLKFGNHLKMFNVVQTIALIQIQMNVYNVCDSVCVMGGVILWMNRFIQFNWSEEREAHTDTNPTSKTVHMKALSLQRIVVDFPFSPVISTAIVVIKMWKKYSVYCVILCADCIPRNKCQLIEG